MAKIPTFTKEQYDEFAASIEDKSWEITEPAIYYQSAYIKLLAHFVE